MRSSANINLVVGPTVLPVQLCPATKTDDVKFTLVAPDGRPVQQKYITDDGEVFGRGECGKAYEGHVLDLDLLKSIEDSAKITDPEVIEFVPLKDIDFWRAEKTYYVQHNKKGGNATLKVFASLVKTLDKKKRAAVTKITPRSRQALTVLHVMDGNLMATVLSFASDVVPCDDAVEAHKQVAVGAQDIAIMEKLMEFVGTEGDALATAQDEAVEQRKQMVEKLVSTGQVTPMPKKAPKPQAGDLMADIEAMLNASKKAA